MPSEKKTSISWKIDRIEYALLTGFVLCAANHGMDSLLDRLGATASKTILNDLFIGILGALAVYFFLSASQERQNFDMIKQRMRLISDLNSRVREAFSFLAASALSEDRWARLRGIDEATDRIDLILSDFVRFRETRTNKSQESKTNVPPLVH